MVTWCCAYECKSRQNSFNEKGSKISFHRFPKDRLLCKKWLLAVRRVDFNPTKYSYLCSEHFTEDQFDRTQKSSINRPRLRANSVPTIFKTHSNLRRNVKQKQGTNFSEIQDVVSDADISDETMMVASTSRPEQNNASCGLEEEIGPSQNGLSEHPNILKIVPSKVQQKIAPKPVASDTTLDPNLIGALKAFTEAKTVTMPPDQYSGTTMSFILVKPDASGPSYVTLPSSNIGSVQTSNLGYLAPSNVVTSPSMPIDNSVDSILTSPKGKIKIKKYEERLKKYRREIKKLQQRNRRQRLKIEKLQAIIKDIRNPSFTDEDDASEDISEEEIYAELLKYQSESEESD